MPHWSERLQQATADKNFTAVELAEKSGVPLPRVYKYLRGKVEQPRGDTLKKLARVLDIKVNDLRDGDHNQLHLSTSEENFTTPDVIETRHTDVGGEGETGPLVSEGREKMDPGVRVFLKYLRRLTLEQHEAVLEEALNDLHDRSAEAAAHHPQKRA